VREQDIRDYKEQDRLAALLVQPIDPASIALFPSSCSVLCGIVREHLLHALFAIGKVLTTGLLCPSATNGARSHPVSIQNHQRLKRVLQKSGKSTMREA
jgi:hypothetical protein